MSMSVLIERSANSFGFGNEVVAVEFADFDEVLASARPASPSRTEYMLVAAVAEPALTQIDQSTPVQATQYSPAPALVRGRDGGHYFWIG